jgi:hypothetical protein
LEGMKQNEMGLSVRDSLLQIIPVPTDLPLLLSADTRPTNNTVAVDRSLQ